MSNAAQLTLEHIRDIEREIQALQTRRNELCESGLKNDQAIVGWKDEVKGLDARIQVLKAQRDRGHTDLANKP
jgi:hypothetical protein